MPEIETIRFLLHPYSLDPRATSEQCDFLVSISKDGRDLTISSGRCELSWTHNGSVGSATAGCVLFPLSEIVRCREIITTVMNPNVALIYRLLTGLPIKYNRAPPQIRSALLRQSSGFGIPKNFIKIDETRLALTDCFAQLGMKLRARKSPDLIITHDIDTRKGLERAEAMKSVEDDLGVESSWFIPSEEFPLNGIVIRDLAEGSQIGSHDTKHDGTLVHMRDKTRLARRLAKSRTQLEEKTGRPIKLFRAPLMQFSREIVNALEIAGYEEDFSLPSWESSNPVVMGGFGIQTSVPFHIGKMVEHPLSLPQDHQLLMIFGLSTQAAVKYWTQQASRIFSLGGDVVLLVHPDYAFSQELGDYKQLISSLKEMKSSIPSSLRYIRH